MGFAPAGKKLAMLIVGALGTGGAIGAAGGYLAGQNAEETVASPNPTLRPSPSPSISIKFSPGPSPIPASSSQPEGSQSSAASPGGRVSTDDDQQIREEVRRYLEASSIAGDFRSARVIVMQGLYAFAEGQTASDGRPFALKKVNGEWVVLSSSKGLGQQGDEDTKRLIEVYGFQQSLIDQFLQKQGAS